MLTGPSFKEEHVLDDGTPVVLRHIRPEDVDELRRGFDKLSPASRRSRFHSALRTLSNDALAYLTNVDGKDHVAIVATARSSDGAREIGLGVGRFIRTPDDPSVAELALTVIDQMQHKGLGRILSMALARAALERGVTRFRAQVLTDNEPVRRLLDELGGVVHAAAEGELVFDVDLRPDEEPAAGSRLEQIARRLLEAAASTRLVGRRP